MTAALATTILTSSVCASVVTFTASMLLEARNSRVDARLSMIEIVSSLEGYAARALDHLARIDRIEHVVEQLENPEQLDQRFETVPPILEIGSAAERRTVGLRSAIRIANFRTAVAQATETARLANSPYLPDARAKVRLYTAEMAVEALDLAKDLRLIWRLRALAANAPSNLRGSLEERREAYLTERATIERRTSWAGGAE